MNIMIRKILLGLVAVCALCLTACSEDENFGPTIFDTSSPSRTALETWILENLTKPHNIEVIYRWNYMESDMSRNLTPPLEDKAEGFIKVIKKIWPEPYVQIAGIDFFNSLTPKQIFLVGSEAYNSSGTVTLGTAESGRKVVIYDVNSFNQSNKTRLVRYMKTIHHEFTHICNQTQRFDPAYEKISPEGYRSDWNNVSQQQAYDAGFITPYACDAPNEDFAEMVAVLLTNTYASWRNMVDNGPTTDSGKASLKAKEEQVVAYYRGVWGFDIYALQAACEEAIDAAVNN